MTKSLFRISYVETGDEILWRDFWGGGPIDDRVQAALDAGRLHLTEYIKASSLAEAKSEFRSLFPDFIIMEEGSAGI